MCSENKGADQLRGYREADLRLCFRIYMQIVDFPMFTASEMSSAAIFQSTCLPKLMYSGRKWYE